MGSFPVQETRVKKWVEYRLGKMAWEFRGEVVRYFEEPERVEADRVVVDFYDEEEVYHSTLLADFGSIDRKSSDMEVWDSVVITNRNGTCVETERACWDNKNEKIYTDAFVTITKGRQVITGYGLETDPGLENAKILREVVVHTSEESDE